MPIAGGPLSLIIAPDKALEIASHTTISLPTEDPR